MKYIIYFFLFNTLSQYSGNEPTIIKSNQVKKVQCYNFKIEDDKILKDSFLMVKRYFNQEGYPIKTFVCDNPERDTAIYEYHYKSDSILSRQMSYAVKTYESTSTAYFDYNDSQKLIKTETKTPNGIIETGSDLKYNKSGQLIEKDIHYLGEIILKETYEYDSRDRLVNITTKRKGKKKKLMPEHHKIYYKDGLKTHIYEYRKKSGEGKRRLVQKLEYDENRRLIQSSSNAYKGLRIIGIGGKQKADPGMRILRKMTYHENGLLKTEKEYIDGALSAYKKYYYQF